MGSEYFLEFQIVDDDSTSDKSVDALFSAF